MAVRLIIGLGNPGSQYARTRHNAGFWFLDALVSGYDCEFRSEKKYHGDVARCFLGQQDCRLLKPSTFMNRSGQAAIALVNFYQIDMDEILVAHDELDLPPGVAKLKRGGGHGGHNGLRDLISHFGSKDFLRLRLGIGHPGDKRLVSDYVLKAASKADHQLIDDAIYEATRVTPGVVNGQLEEAMHQLHSR